MSGLFQRLFKTGQAEAHALVDKFEDPIKMSEQAIRDLKKALQESKTDGTRAPREARTKYALAHQIGSTV